MGWGGITNGKLMALGQQSFDVFVTVDQKSRASTESCQAFNRHPRGGGSRR
jgi:hypothetical protein